jgi:hypothetical protein
MFPERVGRERFAFWFWTILDKVWVVTRSTGRKHKTGPWSLWRSFLVEHLFCKKSLKIKMCIKFKVSHAGNDAGAGTAIGNFPDGRSPRFEWKRVPILNQRFFSDAFGSSSGALPLQRDLNRPSFPPANLGERDSCRVFFCLSCC